jgi:putative ABC transport system substrate-binding protein
MRLARLTTTVLALALLAAPLAAETQQAGKVVRIGYLSPAEPPTPAAPSESLDAFKQGMRALGYVEGRHFAVETRFADAKLDRLPGLAAELVALPVDIIVTIGTPTVKAAKEATATIPIVMAGSGDPVEHGLVASLARPGGNVTGVTHSPGPEISGKGIEILKEAVPAVSRVAVLWDSSGIHEGLSLENQKMVARKLGLTLLPFDAKTLDELRAALAAIPRERANALFVFPNFINGKHFELIMDFARTQRLPTMHQESWNVEHGGLMSYYTDWLDLRRQAAVFVDKILKGAKPGDLAVEQPTKFDLVINLRTAKALGLTIPPALLQRADKIIE